MAALLRFSAVALLAATVCLLLRRSNPELQIPLAAAACAFTLYLTLELLAPVRDFLERAAALSGLSDVYLLPVAKCVVIAIVAKGAADLCRDGGQSAVAGAVELGGAAAALYVSLPLLASLLGFLENLL